MCETDSREAAKPNGAARADYLAEPLAIIEEAFSPWTNPDDESYRLMVSELPYFTRLAAVVDRIRRRFPFIAAEDRG